MLKTKIRSTDQIDEIFCVQADQNGRYYTRHVHLITQNNSTSNTERPAADLSKGYPNSTIFIWIIINKGQPSVVNSGMGWLLPSMDNEALVLKKVLTCFVTFNFVAC